MVRMWLVDPSILYKNHLLGEHNEIHKLCGSLLRKRGITGYVRNNCIQLSYLQERHTELVEEMVKRKYNHKSPLEVPDYSYLPLKEQEYIIDRDANLELLLGRCEKCGS